MSNQTKWNRQALSRIWTVFKYIDQEPSVLLYSRKTSKCAKIIEHIKEIDEKEGLTGRRTAVKFILCQPVDHNTTQLFSVVEPNMNFKIHHFSLACLGWVAIYSEPGNVCISPSFYTAGNVFPCAVTDWAAAGWSGSRALFVFHFLHSAPLCPTSRLTFYNLTYTHLSGYLRKFCF